MNGVENKAPAFAENINIIPDLPVHLGMEGLEKVPVGFQGGKQSGLVPYDSKLPLFFPWVS